MKNATHHKAKRISSPRHLRELPDGLTPRDFEWEDAPCVVAALEARWKKWRKQKDLLDRDWLEASRRRVQAAAAEINADKLKLALAVEEEKRLAYFKADAEENEQFVAALGAAITRQAKARNDAWRASAEARLRRATKAINADINRRDRQLLARKRR
jgi:hypothetical protein